MRRLVGAINMTLDGFSDHTAILPDDQIHEHYTDLLRASDTILYGRITYELMEYWRTIVKNPTGNKDTDGFAVVMNGITKIVFSHTLKSVDWHSAKLAQRTIQEEVSQLKKQNGSDILVGSRSLIMQCLQLNLIDELQLCIHPVVAGNGLPLFEQIKDKTVLKLAKTKAFEGGAVILYYIPTSKIP